MLTGSLALTTYTQTCVCLGTVFSLLHFLMSPQISYKSRGSFNLFFLKAEQLMLMSSVSQFSLILLFCLYHCCCLYLQITLWQIGYTPAPQGRSDVLTQSTRLSNWKRSFCSICTLQETADTRSPECWIWLRGRSKSGFRTGEWRWRRWTKKRPTAKTNNVDYSDTTTNNNH